MAAAGGHGHEYRLRGVPCRTRLWTRRCARRGARLDRLAQHLAQPGRLYGSVVRGDARPRGRCAAVADHAAASSGDGLARAAAAPVLRAADAARARGRARCGARSGHPVPGRASRRDQRARPPAPEVGDDGRHEHGEGLGLQLDPRAGRTGLSLAPPQHRRLCARGHGARPHADRGRPHRRPSRRAGHDHDVLHGSQHGNRARGRARARLAGPRDHALDRRPRGAALAGSPRRRGRRAGAGHLRRSLRELSRRLRRRLGEPEPHLVSQLDAAISAPIRCVPTCSATARARRSRGPCSARSSTCATPAPMPPRH